MAQLREILSRLLEAIRKIRAANGQLFNLVAMTLCAAPAIGLAFYVFNPGAPVLLATNLSPADRTALALRLRRHQITFSLGADSITVPSRSLSQAREVLGQSPGFSGGAQDFGLFDRSTMGQSDFDEQVNYQRSVQGELERTIMNIKGVDSARVMLAMGRPSPFALGQSEAAHGSVMLTTSPGAMIDAATARAIAHLVASSVRGLTPEDVTVTGNDGSILFPAPHESELSEAIRMRSEVEHRLQEKVSALLGRIMGDNRYAVEISVDVDTSRVTSRDELYGKGDQTILSEEHSVTPVASEVGGIPGLTSNLPSPQPSPAASPTVSAETGAEKKNSQTAVNTTDSETQSSRRDIVNYKPSLRQTETVTAPMRIKRISVAGVLDGTYEDGHFHPVPDERLAAVKALIAAAIGAETERGDSVNVQTAALSQPYLPPVPNPVMQLRMLMGNPIYLYGSIGAGLVLIAVLFWIIKRAFSRRSAARVAKAEVKSDDSAPEREQAPGQAKREGAEPPAADSTNKDFESVRMRINREVERDPEAAAGILREWMKQQTSNGASDSHTNGGAPA